VRGMETPLREGTISALGWWGSRRLRYNLILVIAAPISAVRLLLVWWLFEPRLPCLEVTGFSPFAGAALFVVALGGANLLYLLGPITEKLVRPRLFVLSTAFSVLVIFSPVIGNLVAAAIGPAVIGQCT
jgi:hypothetical protein